MLAIFRGGWGRKEKRIKDASKVLAEATERMELFIEIRKATQSEEFWGGRSGFTFGNPSSKCLLDLQVEKLLSQQAFGFMGLYLGIGVCIWKSLALYQQRCEYRLRGKKERLASGIPTVRGQKKERLTEDTEEEPRK